MKEKILTIAIVAGALLLQGCSTQITRDRVRAQAPLSLDDRAADAAIVGLDAPHFIADDEALYARRDQALALRFPGTLAQAESWESAPVPDISRWQRVTVSQRAESYIFFREERSRSEQHYSRYRY
jgi:hypothetical protein